MSRDPFDQMKSRNPMPDDQAPAAPMSVADRIVGRGAVVRAGWPGWVVATAAAAFVLAVGGGMLWWLSGSGTEVAGSSSTTTATTVPPTATTVSGGDTLGDVVAYFFVEPTSPGWTDGPYLIPVSREVLVPGPAGSSSPTYVAAMGLLLAGPTGEEAAQTPAFSTAIPEGTSLEALTVDAGVVTVDLSSEFTSGGGSASMTGRLAQVVYTLTRLDGIDGVRFLIDGTPTTVFGGEGVIVNDPATRADFESALPAVMIETPAWDGAAGNPAVITGTANVFEAVISLALVDDDGLIRWEGTTMATCGTGCRGDWTVTIPYTVDEAQWGSIIVWEASAMDGSQTNVREHRIWLTPSTTGETEGAVYFLGGGDRDIAASGPYLIPVARLIDPSAPYVSTMQALLDGPPAGEGGITPEISTAIPEGTTLNGVTLSGAIAVVDLSAEFTSGGGSFSMMGRLAQVIYTMTRFPEIDGVRFLIDGTPTTVFGGEGVTVDDPATRPDDDTLLPAVMIESPAFGAVVGEGVFSAAGTANVFEATVSIVLRGADGGVLFEGFTTATCGTGCRGAWELDIPYEVDTAQWGRLEAFESSAMDGSPVNVRTHLVWLTPAGGSTTTTTSPVVESECSGMLATTTLEEQPGLPEAVAQKRNAIWDAAVECDWDQLERLLGAGFSYSFGGSGDAIAFWQGLEADGDDPIYYLAELLNRPFGTLPGDKDQTYYTWPSAFNQSGWQDLSQADIDALRPLYGDAEIAGFAQNGAYIGYRVGILDDGTWVYFLSGD
ncbi:MAG TPA: GerMN domain-containing protein [Acidimicrobiia bacterium]|nr:GerMN domain-containing protein [Acidimicrobiia bacterium]